MPQVKGLKSLVEKLKAQGAKGKRVDVLVGYTQNYALAVHENLSAYHTVGQAKYLEQPARENKKRYAAIVRALSLKGVPLDQALVAAGLELQRDSMLLVPVDTGALKASAFTKRE